ncbi:hypothetical protein jhhlp_004513 [Lomentospora prolificans]|uniref:GIT Spa2 homology (SHD) domain-containing protein n=1 Tax=Lomentospora prolificans TaxID=41688 RepID=A0A2N3NBS5_9PEZI|nr:hypothetical protein jhhlp_004513 [Lomentospora prolificans]
MSKYGDGGPFPNRGQLISPPNSGGSNGGMNGFPPVARSVGGPSPPPSIGRSSNGTGMYARSESGRSTKGEETEAILGEHYLALRRFLNGRNGRTTGATAKAKDKLLRLTGVQFVELSTDVYDELIRPRQKLSSLGPDRFQSLVTDVFTELERRFPNFVDGDIPPRMSISRSGTPANGLPPRNASRRRPSDASSIRQPGGTYPYSIPPSPSIPPGDFGRPLQKQFQSNTIVPNKSTMVEEDDDADEREPFAAISRAPTGLNDPRSPDTQASPVQSESDKRLIEDYQIQVQELREKLDGMEDTMKKKEDEMNRILDDNRSRASAANMEKKEWDDLRVNLENKLAEAQDLNESLRDEIERMRSDHASETRELRNQLADMENRIDQERQNAAASTNSSNADRELQRENRELQDALREQQSITEEVRRNAQEALREMRALSQQSTSAYERQEDLERTVDQLEQEVRDWRNRYTRAKTQLRSMRASSLGLPAERDATKYLRERGLTADNGLIKDVHVTKFQVAIDETLQLARTDMPEKVMDAMKAVIVGVRRITKDIDETGAASRNDEFAQQVSKAKGKVSGAANAFITAAKNHANSAGISPVSILDASASHLVAAVVELLQMVKMRPTPAGELEDEDDDGTTTPLGSNGGFFSPQSSRQESMTTQESLAAPAPPFRGLGGRLSADSSAYSPVNSPRESRDQAFSRPPMNGINGMSRIDEMNGNGMNGNYYDTNKNLPAPPSNNYGNLPSQYGRSDDLKIYLEDQTAVLVSSIQNLVGSIRSNASIEQITDEIDAIDDVVGRVINETQSGGNGQMATRLEGSRDKLLNANKQGQNIAAKGKGPNDREWKMWTQNLPPIAFELAREMKELVQQVDQLALSNGDDFA